MRRLGAVLLALGSLTLTMWAPGPASATDYRYWTYWTGTANGWTPAGLGGARGRQRRGLALRAEHRGARARAWNPDRCHGGLRQFCGPQPAALWRQAGSRGVRLRTAGRGRTGRRRPAPWHPCAEAPEQATGATILSRSATVRSDVMGLSRAIRRLPAGRMRPAVTSGMTPSPRTAPRINSPQRPSEEALPTATLLETGRRHVGQHRRRPELPGAAAAPSGTPAATPRRTRHSPGRDARSSTRTARRPTPTPVSTPPPDAGSPTQPRPSRPTPKSPLTPLPPRWPGRCS